MDTDHPLVSILINNYNYGSYVGAAIDSALQQTYPRTEVIVVDDGSTDQSRQIISSYDHQIIPVLKDNGGQASALNAAFAISHGEILGLLDADDLWLPEKVEQVVQAFRQTPQAAVVYHKVQNIDASARPRGQPWPPYPVIRGNIAHKVTQTGGWWPFPPSTGLSFSRTFLATVMDIPEAPYRLCADAFLADLAPFLGEVVGIDQVLSLFRIHGANQWSHSHRDSRVAVRYHETRIQILNAWLNQAGIDQTVSLTDHWPYQHLKFQAGQEQDLIYLSKLILKNPWEVKIHSKIKTIVKLVLARFGIGKSRQ